MLGHLLASLGWLGAPDPLAVPTPSEVPPPAQPTTAIDPIQWSAPAGCPDAVALRAGVERRLGRSLLEGEVTVEARVQASGEGHHRLELRTRASGVIDTRSFDADDCTSLVDAAALVVALAVDPLAVAARAVHTEAGAADELGDPVAPAVTTSARVRAEDRGTSPVVGRGASGVTRTVDRRPAALFRIAGGVGLGAVPRVSGAVSLAAGLRWHRGRLELEGSYWIPRTTERLAGSAVRVQLGTVAVRGCGQLVRERFDAVLCAGPQLGGMRGDGKDARNARTAAGVWFGLGAGVALSWWFRPRWALAGGLDVAVPVVHPAFRLAGATPVQLYAPAAVSGRLWLGIEVRTRSP